MIIDYLININLSNAEADMTDASIGLYSGVLKYASADVSYYTSDTYKTDALMEKWGGTSSRVANVARGGAYASVGGSSIKLRPNFDLLETLDTDNQSLYMAIVTITTIVDGVEYSTKYGQITKVNSNSNYIELVYDDVSRAYDVGVNRYSVSGEPFPFQIGTVYSKASKVEEEQSTITMNGFPAVFKVGILTPANKFYYGSSVFLYPADATATEADADALVAEITAGIANGATYYISQNGIRKAIEAISVFSALTELTLLADLVVGNSIVDGLTESVDDVDKTDYCVIGSKKEAYYYDNDSDATGIITENGDVPVFSDGIVYGDGVISIADADGYGWEPVLPANSTVVGRSIAVYAGGVGVGNVPYTYTGSSDSVYDNDLDTYLELEIGLDVANGTTTELRISRDSFYYDIENTSIGNYDSLVVSCNVNVEKFGWQNAPSSGDVILGVNVKAEVLLPWGNEEISYSGTSGAYVAISYPYTVAKSVLPTTIAEIPDAIDSESFLWRARNDAGGTSPLNYASVQLDVTSLITNLPDYMQDAGVGIRLWFEIDNVWQYTNYIKWRVRDLRLIGKRQLTSGDVYVETTGRDSSSGVEITDIKTLYESALYLQNYENYGAVTAPLSGWGKAYPSFPSPNARIDDSSYIGGTNYSGVPTYSVAKSYEGDVTTKTIKEDCLNAMYCVGAVTRNGKEQIFPLIEALYDENDGFIVTLDMIKGYPTYSDRAYADIFPEPNVKYAYNAVTGSHDSYISISNVEQGSYSASYINGVSDANKAEELWNMGNLLYKAYGVKNVFPEKRADLGLLTSEADAIEYIENVYKWCGVVTDAGQPTGRKRYSVSFSMRFDYVVQNGIDIGSPIRLQVPHMTYDPAIAVSSHTGIVVGVTDTIGGDNPYCTIKAEMLGDNMSGSNVYIFTETGAASTVITESGSQDYQYIEV